MSGVSVDVAAVAVVTAGGAEATPVPDRRAGWWRAWRDRFGLAEVCGTLAAVAGFAAGYAQAGSLLAAAALATIGEAIGFYGCIAVKSCAVAETVDGFLIRPGCMAGAAWLMRPLPGGVWLGFAVGKAVADVAWYGLEASARRSVRIVRAGVTARPVRDREKNPA